MVFGGIITSVVANDTYVSSIDAGDNELSFDFGRRHARWDATDLQVRISRVERRQNHIKECTGRLLRR